MSTVEGLLRTFALMAMALCTLASAADYEVIWNIPSKRCLRKKITLHPELYGIKVHEGQEYYGKYVALFHETRFGLYPYYKNHSDDTTAINGGIPQKASLSAHLIKVKTDVESAIPDVDFDGAANIDFEQWKPIFSSNWGHQRIYKTQSVAYVRERFPHLKGKAAWAKAEQEFNVAARNFMLETIETCKKLRPKAKWGFYGFPYCNFNAGAQGESICSDEYRSLNDQQEPLTKASTGLFPSVYVYANYADNRNFLRVHALMNETGRFNKEMVRKPVYVFAKFEYDPIRKPEQFYTEQDLCRTMKQARELGADAALLWSLSNGLADRCAAIETYMSTTFGPFVQKVLKVQKVCEDGNCDSTDKCT